MRRRKLRSEVYWPCGLKKKKEGRKTKITCIYYLQFYQSDIRFLSRTLPTTRD